MFRQGYGLKDDASQSMENINRTVLRLISQKKYPLNPSKINQIRRNKEKYQLTQLHTSLKECCSPSKSAALFSGAMSRIEDGPRSMGEHFQALNTRHLSSPFRASEDLEEVNNKINNFIWFKKQELLQKHSFSTTFRCDGQNKGQPYPGDNHKNYIRNSSFNCLPIILRNLRTKMSKDVSSGNQPTENIISKEFTGSDFFVKNHRKNFASCDFYQDQEGMADLMRRYPVKRSHGQKQNLNRQLKREMVEQVKENLNSDKFGRVRIARNHKKIVGMG